MPGATQKKYCHGLPVVVMAILVAAVIFVPRAGTIAQAEQEALSNQNLNAIAGDREDDLFQRLKKKMIANQMIARGINDPEVIRALERVDRHLYVPGHLRHLAYEDRPLPIGEGQTISQPYIVAFMTQVLKLKNTDRVLEIGTGSGYQAAILAEIAGHVFTIEIIESLGRRAEQTLEQAGYTNIEVKIGDGYLGWPEEAPFDAIMVTCSPTSVPDPLKEQLAEGGTMIIPVGQKRSQKLVLLEKQDGRLVERDSLPVRFVPMVDEKGKTY